MELDKNKTKYFVIAIILLIILGVILIVHFNNKSMVSGDKEDNTTKKTTEKITEEKTTKKVTTTKVESKEISDNQDVYKSTVDNDTKLLFNYKLTDEISETDIIISKVLTISEDFKNNNIVGLYDISLYDSNLVKKSVNNSLITISIPIVGNLVGYDDYKIVYIDNDNNITDEEFNTTISSEYITFNTTHLSVYGVIGIKNEEEKEEKNVDLEDINVKIAFNDVTVEDNNTIYTTTNDTVDITVTGVDNPKVYYGLQDKDNNLNYKEYTNNKIFSDLTTYSEQKLFVKVVVGSQEKVFELNSFKVYDFIYLYDKNNPEAPEYTSEDTVNYLLKDITEEAEEQQEESEYDSETDMSIYINGNIYVVEKADISELEMTGTLFIDTKDKIDLGTAESTELINSKGLDRIVIMSEYFNLNGVEYKYSIDKSGNVTITKVEDESDVTEEFDEAFDTEVEISTDEDENLVIDFIREISSTDIEEEQESTAQEISSVQEEIIQEEQLEEVQE